MVAVNRNGSRRAWWESFPQRCKERNELHRAWKGGASPFCLYAMVLLQSSEVQHILMKTILW